MSRSEWDEATDLLRRGLARIEKGWCQGASARDADGRKCAPWSPNATEWCATGALSAEDPLMSYDIWALATRRLYQSRPRPRPTRRSVGAWQDDPDREKAEVIDLYRRAIAMEEPSYEP